MKTPSHTLESNSAIATGAIPASTPRQPAGLHPNGGWMPRPWSDQLGGCVFLPRMLEKGRRLLQGERTGRDLMNGFLFGDLDYADGQMLRFLRTKETRVLELLGELEDDETVAATLFQEAGRSVVEIAAWSRRFRRINAPFTPMWDADEGRRAPGWGTAVLNWFYNAVMMPPVYLGFRILSARRCRRLGSR